MSTLKVGSIDYTIKMDTDILKAKGLWGEIDYVAQTVSLRSDLSAQRLFQTLCHEVVHALLEEAGLESINKEEVVNPLGNILALFLTDNYHRLGVMIHATQPDTTYADGGEVADHYIRHAERGMDDIRTDREGM